MKKIYLILLLIFSQFFFAQSDCASAIRVCGNSDISYFPTGPGSVDDQVNANGSCLSANEHYSVWYEFTVATAGTLTFTISPQAPYTADYDFAVYGPNKTCGTKGAPIRCNYAGAQAFPNQTGLQTGLTANSGAWSPALNVLPGETYYLIVDNWSGANAAMAFSLTWGGTATLTSPFNDPAIQPNPFNPIGIPGATASDPRIIEVCDISAPYNFQTNSANIVNGNPNFYVKYYRTSNDALADTNAITSPIVINTTSTYYYTIRYLDPTNPNNPTNKCFNVNAFKFKDVTFKATNASLTSCNNNNNGVAVYDLTSTTLYTPNPNYTYVIKYYPTLADANNGTNEILNPAAYTSSTGDVYAKITTNLGCSDIAKITLNFFPVVVVTDATLRSCYLDTNPAMATFDLTLAPVTTQAGTKTYYPSLTDAINGTNAILNPSTYTAPNGVAYIKVTNGNGCYAVAKVTLIVLPPVYSSVLEDKIICMEDKTTLDAGPGFTAYKWSTGATTQAINNVTVGTYWVELKTGNCVTKQTVKVYPSEQPVISSIDITNNTITVNVIGGTAPYKYSLDGIKWQDSNVFENVARGDNTVYVKDGYDCDPLTVTVVVPNLINVITPNGDGVNDVIDYSALAGKQGLVLSIFDRYGVKVGQADKSNGYKWDGTTNGKKIPTGTYWYTVEWKENDKKNTPFKFSGWVMVKNRE
ncbi:MULTISPECIES: T9SS type B sorting domain-containing protein [Chryseobacterium]|uniref:Gliding motility-associated C-terminal domain-containing protein n=1 Tax=Candidatus Chryseobacterium massiliense TaxID=204089 RepID=A0A3D9BDP0_9FLAO|nr:MULTISPECIES: T9SS type B sorting domain-containing protein [Chryseobacterium]REC51695.1 gliding motility-associated C-terminal domain-containing protein [Candidatus Chryseobacterium massiliae]